MARWALIKNGRLATVTEQDTQPTLSGEWIDVTGKNVGPGFEINGEVFTRPSLVVRMTPRDFMRRFTPAEREQLEELAATGAAAVQRKLAAFKFYLQIGGNVELSDDYIIASVQAMESAGVLAAGRAQEILT